MVLAGSIGDLKKAQQQQLTALNGMVKNWA